MTKTSILVPYEKFDIKVVEFFQDALKESQKASSCIPTLEPPIVSRDCIGDSVATL
jgi:hypothetical protein